MYHWVFLLKIVVAILKAHKIGKELIKSKFTYAYNSIKNTELILVEREYILN